MYFSCSVHNWHWKYIHTCIITYWSCLVILYPVNPYSIVTLWHSTYKTMNLMARVDSPSNWLWALPGFYMTSPEISSHHHNCTICKEIFCGFGIAVQIILKIVFLNFCKHTNPQKDPKTHPPPRFPSEWSEAAGAVCYDTLPGCRQWGGWGMFRLQKHMRYTGNSGTKKLPKSENLELKVKWNRSSVGLIA